MRTKRRDLKEVRQGRRPEPQFAESGQPSRLDGCCLELIKMIAGAGMSLTAGGAGMLRARRRDISIKPNRKLDRKSSRGMIYENEELRLRTIHINAEVEQGQSDIKKLRRENEQLRREIWSLRDEYDKLDEMLKKQQSREESDEPENRSENEAAGSEYSEDEEDDNEEDDEEDASSSSGEEHDQEERLENAENQKISSEKLMNNNNNNVVAIRACGTLPVVTEEEELKKEKKEFLATEQAPVIPSTQHNQYGLYQTSTPLATALTSFGSCQTTNCPFVFPEPNTGYPSSSCHPASCPLSSSFNTPPPPGWQSFPTMQLENGSSHQPAVTSSPNLSTSLAERRRAFFRQQGDTFNASGSQNQGIETAEASHESEVKSRLGVSIDEAACSEAASESKPRHFFAPLKSRSPMRSMYDDASTRTHSNNSPSSETTASTVVSRERYNCEKGSADICVNGAVPCTTSNIETGDAKAFFSSENILVEARAANYASSCSSNLLTKSVSCQDLSSRLSFTDGNFKSVTNAKSDNTLDNISVCSRGYRSQLNVTLRTPRKTPSPDTPEIPKLPAIDYKLFNNPFLQNFEQAYQNFPVRTEGPSPVTHPLSIQVCESPVSATSYSSPVRVQPSFSGPSAETTADCVTCKRKDLERLRLMMPSVTKTNETYHVTSFETPSPHTLQIPPMTPYELEALRRMPTITSPIPQTNNSRLYQNVPFVPRGAEAYGSQRLYHDTMKVPAQTQTSPDEATSTAQSKIETKPESSQLTPDPQKKRRSRKEKSVKEKRQSQKLKKQTSVTSRSEPTETKSREDDKNNESRSSSSGQDSPKKDHTKRVSLYLSTKKRPSLSSTRTSRSRSIERTRAEAMMEGNNSERERTNSISSRDVAVREKIRKNSTSSGSVPWCACWGNGCI